MPCNGYLKGGSANGRCSSAAVPALAELAVRAGGWDGYSTVMVMRSEATEGDRGT